MDETMILHRWPKLEISTLVPTLVLRGKAYNHPNYHRLAQKPQGNQGNTHLK